MRVAVDAHRLALPEELKRSGGIYLSNLVSSMAALRPSSTFLLYLNRKASAFHPELPNCVLRPIPGPRIVWRHVYLPLAAWRDRAGVLFIPFRSVPVTWRRPLVAVIHGLAFLAVPEFFSVRTCRYLKAVTAYAVKRADRLIAVSQSTKQDLEKYYGPCIANKTSVVYEAPAAVFTKSSEPSSGDQVLSRFGLDKNSYFIAVGTHPIKNLGGTLEAFRIARDEFGVKAKLVVVGSLGKGVASLVARKGVESAVILTGSVSSLELKELYANAIALVFPSFYEGFGLPLVEAMSCGCPVITSNISSMPEIAGEAGILVNPHRPADIAHAIKSLCSNDEIQKRLSQVARERAKLFSWEEAAKKTLRVLEAVAE